jgi:LPS sulfotransferase NodH
MADTAPGRARARREAPPLFDPSVEETRRSLKIAGSPLPQRCYFIAFTARSGSSRFCDLLASAGTLGEPGEALNPKMVPRISRALAAPDLETYLDRHRRFRQTGGSYGMKLTSPHAETLFGSMQAFLAAHRGWATLFLIREDVVAQAVSSYLMRFQTVVHRVEGGAAERIEEAPYDAAILRKIVTRFTSQEETWEAAFAAHDLKPLRLSQESMLAADDRALVARVADHVGAPRPADRAPASRHRKLGTSLNQRLTARFREEEAGFLADVAASRAQRLQALDVRQG